MAESKKIFEYFVVQELAVQGALLRLLEINLEKFSDVRYTTIHNLAEQILDGQTSDLLDEKEQKYDTQLLQLIDYSLVENFVSYPDKEELLVRTERHLQILAAATNYLQSIKMYSVEDLIKIFSGDLVDFDVIRVVFTLRQIINSDESHNVALKIALPVVIFAKQDEFTRAEAFMLCLCADLLWSAFPTLPPQLQELLVSSFFCLAIVMGVPIFDEIEKAFILTTSAFAQLSLNKTLLKYIAENKENILVAAGAGKVSRWQEIDRSSIDNFYLNAANNSSFVNWLANAIDIYTALQNSEFFDKSLKLDPAETEENIQIMDSLVKNFLEKDWNKIGIYFKQPEKKRLPLNWFLVRILFKTNLKKEENVHNLLEFTVFLQGQGVLKKDEEIIEFHDDDGEFHWKKELSDLI